MDDILRSKILQRFAEEKNRMLNAVRGVKLQGEFIKFPIMVDMVIDTVVYRVKDNKFVAIEVQMAVGQQYAATMVPGDTSVHCDDSRIEILQIPEELQ